MKEKFERSIGKRMREMRFDVDCAKVHLMDYGSVFTLRKWKIKGLKNEVFGQDVYVRDVGRCVKFLVGEVRKKEQLERYLQASGFRTLDEWWNKVLKFCGDGDKYLYEVKVMDKENGGLERWIH